MNMKLAGREVKAVVFDMDGVLFDTERMSTECFFQAGADLGLKILDEAVYGCFGMVRADCRRHVRETEAAVYPDGSFPEEAYFARITELFEARLAQEVPMMKGTKEILEFLKKHRIPIAIASSTNEKRILSNLDHNGLRDYFDAIVTGESVTHSKPAPDIYLKACELLGVEPALAAAVEDSPNGIRSANAAGMITVMIPDMLAPNEELNQLMDICFDSLTAMQEAMKQA